MFGSVFCTYYNTYGINRHAWYLLIIRLSFVSPNTPIIAQFFYFATLSRLFLQHPKSVVMITKTGLSTLS